MADLKILKKDGWTELSGVEAAIKDRALDMRKLWEAIARADTAQSAIILFAAGFDLDDVDVMDVLDVTVLSLPDDLLGHRYRIWVKLKK